MPVQKPKSSLERRRALAREGERKHASSVNLPPLLRVKRAPGEINPKAPKRGGMTRGHKMVP